MKKKALHLITGLEIGGAEMMLLKVLPPLQTDLENIVCCIRGRGPIGQKLEAQGVSVHYLDLASFFDWRAISRFKQVVRKVQPDLLVTYLIHADLFGRVLGRVFGIPKIICSVRVKLVQAKYLPFLFLDGLTSFLVDHYHFNSQTVAEMYQKYFFLSPKKTTVIPNGLDLSLYTLSPEQIQAKRQELNLTNKTIIGCLAKLRAQKGHPYLIEAFEKIHTKHPETVLLLIGDGEERARLEEQVKNLHLSPYVVFLGNRQDIPELLSIIDIFVFPTLFEGMSNALMEAMASSLPIITTNIPENREFLSHDSNALLIPQESSEAILEATERLLGDIKKGSFLAKNARLTALQRFDLQETLTRYRELFRA